MNTILSIVVGLVMFSFSVALAPLVAGYLQKNGLEMAINARGQSSTAILTAGIERFPVDLGGNNAPGLIYAANEARFDSSHYREPLTAYTVGWRDPESLDVLMERLFPSVTVPRFFEFKKADNAAAFTSEDDDDARAIGSPFKRVESRGTTVVAKTINRGLTTRVDHDEALSDNWRQEKISWLMQRLHRNEFRRSVAITDAAANNTNTVWGAASNPDKTVRQTLKAGADISGVRPNVVLFGEAAADLRLDVFEGANTPYAGRAAGMSPADMARKYMVDLVEVVKARYQATTTTKASVISSVVYAYLAIQGAQKDDPSNFKRFMSPTQKGTRYAVYEEPHPKFTDLSVECYSAPTITSDLGIRKRTVSAS